MTSRWQIAGEQYLKNFQLIREFVSVKGALIITVRPTGLATTVPVSAMLLRKRIQDHS